MLKFFKSSLKREGHLLCLAVLALLSSCLFGNEVKNKKEKEGKGETINSHLPLEGSEKSSDLSTANVLNYCATAHSKHEEPTPQAQGNNINLLPTASSGDTHPDLSLRMSNKNATQQKSPISHVPPSSTKPLHPKTPEAPGFHFSSVFSNPRNEKDERNGYVSIDNLHRASGSRLIIPKEKQVKNIFSLLDDPATKEHEIKNLFKVIGDSFKSGLEQHHSVASTPKSSRPLELVVINTNLCCSIPQLLHIQLYSGYNCAPYDNIGGKDFTSMAPIYQNNSFCIYNIPAPNKAQIGTSGVSMVVLFRDPSRGFADFFNLLHSDPNVLEDYTDVLSWFKDKYPNIRSFMVPNLTSNPRYAPYMLSNNRFCMYVYSSDITPSYSTL